MCIRDSKQLQRSSPKSAFHPVKASSYNNGMLPMNFKRSSPLQTRCSPQGFQVDEESKLRESPSYAGAKFSEAPPPDCLPSPPVGWVQRCSMVPNSPVSFRQMENSLKTMLKVAS
ncbi:proline-rich nuclear receptor coactivator 2-like [Anneissia japonica]|uniref:proline-rich nuclear receptor coactivator 2-like n=1 Tax=Anneissia japonica TaxID=1529436 RepID=UPI0014255FCF|nr:proline-rich nuclear receptor coactivator 2-like [Anneissia japonica]